MGDLDERADEPAARAASAGCRRPGAVDLDDRRAAAPRARQRLRAAREVVERDRARRARGGPRPARRACRGRRSARGASARGRSARGRRRGGSTAGQIVRSEHSTSSTARGSRLTNRTSPSGSSGSPTSSAAVRARESKEKSASWASAAAISSPPRTSTAPSLPRISASRPNTVPRREVDDRLEVRRHLAVREELGEPVGAARSSSVSAGIGSACVVGEAHREQAGALGVRERAQEVLQAVVPRRAGEHEALDGDVALDAARSPCARPCTARTGGATAVARRRRRSVSPSRVMGSASAGGLGSSSAAGADAVRRSLQLVDRALAGDVRRARRTPARPPAAPSPHRARRRSASARGAARRPCGRARRPRRASGARARPVRSGRGSVASISSRSVPRANSHSASLGEQSAPKVSRAARRRASSTAFVGQEVRDGPEAQRSAARARASSLGRVLAQLEGVLDVVGASSRRRRTPAEGLGGARRRDAAAAGRAWRCPGWPPTGTGCWRGA